MKSAALQHHDHSRPAPEQRRPDLLFLCNQGVTFGRRNLHLVPLSVLGREMCSLGVDSRDCCGFPANGTNDASTAMCEDPRPTFAKRAHVVC